MKTISISEAKTNPANMPIPRIVGKIKMKWDRKTGTNANGDWSMESGILTNGEDDIKFTLSGCPALLYGPGDNIVLRCKDGKKGLTGVKTKVEEYQGKSQPVLWITPTAYVVSDDEDTDAIPMDFDKSGDMTATEARKQAPQATTAPKKAIPTHNESVEALMRSQKRACGAEDGVQVVKRRLLQMANFRALCDASVEYLYGEGASDEMKKDVSSCFFIQGMREGLEKNLPSSKPISKKEDVEASENLEEKEDVQF